jgi:hypothetical protein
LATEVSTLTQAKGIFKLSIITQLQLHPLLRATPGEDVPPSIQRLNPLKDGEAFEDEKTKFKGIGSKVNVGFIPSASFNATRLATRTTLT